MYATHLPVDIYRGVSRCFKPDITTENREIEEILHLIVLDSQLDYWYNQYANSKISREEYFEAVEPLFGTKEMDSYISEVNLNLEHLCKHGMDSHRANSSGLQVEQIQRRFGN